MTSKRKVFKLSVPTVRVSHCTECGSVCPTQKWDGEKWGLCSGCEARVARPIKAVIIGALKGIATLIIGSAIGLALVSPFLGICGVIYSVVIMCVMFGYFGYIQEKENQQ